MHTVRRSLAGRAQCRGRFECSLPVFLQRAPHSPRRVEGTRTQDQMWQVKVARQLMPDRPAIPMLAVRRMVAL